MSLSRTLYLSPRQRRTFLSTLFGFTAAVSVLTVAGSDVLPCPARSSTKRFAEEGPEAELGGQQRVTRGRAVVEKRPRRWIEETKP